MLCTMCMHGIMVDRAWEHCGKWHCSHMLECPHCRTRRRKHTHDYRPTSQITGFSHAALRIYECECGARDAR